ncbi:MAG: negative regulator of flagellin synthesis FlgM [Alteromonadaceae bacterium]|jgi:negative regulator of flagellin synthesis FlgM
MAININNLGGPPKVNQTAEQQAQVKQQATQTSNNTQQARQDSVSITPQAQKMSELQKKASEAPITDQKNIERLKKSILSGEYKVDADRLTKNMMAFEFKLFDDE